MLPVRQTIFDCVKGNCLAACFASILECPLDEVPHVISEDGWWELYQAWFAERGIGLLAFDASGEWYPPGYVVCGGVSQQGHPHAVVLKDGEEVWNPTGSDSQLAARQNYMVFTLLDPSKQPQG